MRELKELVSAVSKHKIKRIDILDQTMDTKSKIGYFYNLIASSESKSEQEIVKLLAYKSSEDPSYKKLKSRLKKKLIDTLFFIDFNQPLFTEYQKAFNHAYKDWAAIRLLLNKTARTTAIKLARNIFKTAIKFEFNDLILLLAKDLRFHYGYVMQDKKQYNYYNGIISKYYILLQTELEIEQLLTEFLINYNSLSSKSQEDFIASESSKIENVIIELNKNSSFRYNFLGYLYICFYLQVQGKDDELLKYCDKAIRFFETKNIISKNPMFMFNQQKLIALLKLKKYSKCFALGDELRTIPTPGSINWYLINYYYIITCFHSKEYSRASSIVSECFNHSKFDYLPDSYKQLFEIIRAFSVYINDDLKIIQLTRGTKFKIYKFINDVPLFSKEKRGLNISILILHFLFLIKQKKYFAAIDRVEALKQYSYRYIKKDDNFRSNCFIKMLLQVPKADFNPKRAERYATKYYLKLKSNPISISSQPIDIEIIPYEDLWDITLMQLNNIKKTNVELQTENIQP